MHACLEICVTNLPATAVAHTASFQQCLAWTASFSLCYLANLHQDGEKRNCSVHSVQVPQKQQGPQKMQWVHFRSWANLRRGGWCTRCLDVPWSDAVLQGMARCEHILQGKGESEQLIKKGSDLILKQVTDCCNQLNLGISAPYCGWAGWWRGLSWRVRKLV